MSTRNATPTLVALGVSVLLGGCASMPDRAQQTAADSRECKIVLVSSASQEISAYVADMRGKSYVQQTPVEQDFAIARVLKAQVNDRRLRAPPLPNTLDNAVRGC